MVKDGEGDRGDGGFVVHGLVKRHVLDRAFDCALGVIFEGRLVGRDLRGEHVHLNCGQRCGRGSVSRLRVVVG